MNVTSENVTASTRFAIYCAKINTEGKLSKSFSLKAGIKERYSSSANDGSIKEATFSDVFQVTLGLNGETIFAADSRAGLRKIENDHVSTIFSKCATSVALDDFENIYFGNDDGIHKWDGKGYETICMRDKNETSSVDGQRPQSRLTYARRLFFDSPSGLLYFTESRAVRAIRVVKPPVYHDTRLCDDLTKLIDSDDVPTADQVTFLVEGKPIRVSKTIVCIRSKYFRTMFQSGFKEATPDLSAIAIENTTYDAFYALISFLVTGRIDMRKCQSFLLDLLLLSDQYLVNDLKLVCSQHLVENAQRDSETILDHMHFAERHGFKELLDCCLDVVLPDLKNVYYRQEAFKRLGSSALYEVISRLVEKD